MVTDSTNISFLDRITNTTPAQKDGGGNDLGQEDFLMLLTTQMQNQDPSKPMDPSSFITDLTQMSQLESTNKMQETLEEVSLGFKNLQVLQGTALIGKSVEAFASGFSHEQGSEKSFGLDVSSPLKNTKIDISNEDGDVIKTIRLGDIVTGLKNISWDGSDNNGNDSPGGNYTITAYGEDNEQNVVAINTIIATEIDSITVEDGGAISLTLSNGETTALDSVRRISN